MSQVLEVINVNDIEADDAFNCRGIIDPLDVAELAQSIQDYKKSHPESTGLVQPVVIAKTNDPNRKPYKLVAGFRRYTAISKVLKWEEISAIVHESMSDDQAFVINISENLQRENLTFAQEAAAIKRLTDSGKTLDDVSLLLSKSYGWIQPRHYYNNLPDGVQKLVRDEVINQTQIRSLYTVIRDEGERRCLEEAAKIRDAVKEGRKPTPIESKKSKSTTKKQRSKGEIIDLLDHLAETMPDHLIFGDDDNPQIVMRCLAWCCGSITSGDLWQDLKKFADANGVDYEIPTEMKKRF